MQPELLLKCWNGNSLADAEYESIREGFSTLCMALDDGNPEPLLALPPVYCALYLYATRSPANLCQVSDVACAFLAAQGQVTVPASLAGIVGQLWSDLQSRRTGALTHAINLKQSLAKSMLPDDYASGPEDPRLVPLYANASDKLYIDFNVKSLPFQCEVLDPRIIRIAPNKVNELHKHAHETLFIILQGSGRVQIDALSVAVRTGSIVYVPRWCMHQSVNEGTQELIILAIADYGLTSVSFVGNYLKTARLNPGKA